MNATRVFGDDGMILAEMAAASWLSPQPKAPIRRIERRPTRYLMENMPTLTPRKPRHVFMIEYWNGLVTPVTE
jgi:hypothetical protein